MTTSCSALCIYWELVYKANIMLEHFPKNNEGSKPKGYLRTPEAGNNYQRLICSEAANAIHWIGIAKINRQEVTRVGVNVPSQWAGELLMKQIGRTVEDSDVLNTSKPTASYNHTASLARTKEFNHSDPRDLAAKYPQGIRLVFDHASVEPDYNHGIPAGRHLQPVPDQQPPFPPDSAA